MATVTLVPTRARGEAAVAALYVVLEAAQPRPGARHLLGDVDRVVIGRGEAGARRVRTPTGATLELALPDRHLSSAHAELVHGLAGWMIRDLGSKNGVAVDGERVAERVLDDGDWIEVGETILRYRVGELAPATADDVVCAPDGSLVPAVENATRRLADAATSAVPVLLLGPSGAGKHAAAQLVHACSGRPGRFVAVECAGLDEARAAALLFGDGDGAGGAIAAADHGTLLLADIADLPLAVQAPLLRVLQDREVVAVGATAARRVDVRVVAASRHDLEREVEGGRFRVDLYAQLAGLHVALPALRDRLEDLGTLVAAALARHAPDRALGLTAAAARALCEHRWPRNLQELDLAIAAAVAVGHGDRLGDELAEQIGGARTSPAELAAARRAELVARLREHRGNIAAVARSLATSRAQVHRLLRRFELDVETYRR
jgi:transcriptional regulator of acetoin/glycerol metabolism